MAFGTNQQSNFGGQQAVFTFTAGFETDATGAAKGYFAAGGKGCLKSSDCGSGFSCVNGTCEKLENGSSAASTPGDCTDGPISPTATCGTPGTTTCSTPGCSMDGGMDEPLDCCASEVIYVEIGGEVKKKCPGQILAPCNQYCTDFLQANAVERFGCARIDEFTDGTGNACGSCESCDFVGDSLRCVPKLELGEDAPCWCDKGARCDKCESCQYQDSFGDYGLCTPYNAEERNAGVDECKECVQVTDPKCPCGVTLSGTYKACKVYGRNVNSDPVSGLRSYIESLCDKECPDCEEESSDADCTTTTYRIYSDQDANDIIPTCPYDSTCSIIGTIEAVGGEYTEIIRKVCPLPDDDRELDCCLPIECQCPEECPTCYACSAFGTCESINGLPGVQPCTPPSYERPEQYNPETGEGVLGV